MCELLTRVACAWSGVPLPEADVALRTRQLTAMFDYAGSIGPRHWQARLARIRAERWIEDIIQRCRDRQLEVPHDSATHVIATHCQPNGEPLTRNVAAVELLNVLRPTVAVAVYLTFAALALHHHPACRQALQTSADDYAHLFAQEVRRFYPFFPAVGAKTRHDFDWNGYRFPKDTPVILDLYGTNHDPRAWNAPDQFQPDRFRHWDMNPYNFIPQGGGDSYVNHRCPGELIAIELLKVAAKFLAQRITYEVPPQDLALDMTRLPAVPKSHFAIANVRLV
jgi:fatty-acid peroxygenase